MRRSILRVAAILLSVSYYFSAYGAADKTYGYDAAANDAGTSWPLATAGKNITDRMSGLCGHGMLQDGEDGLATFWLTDLWGFKYRDDLGALRSYGVRALKLHRCVVTLKNLRNFLDRAWNQGLTVMPELPASIYQRVPGGCFSVGATPTFRDFDCYAQVRSHCYDLLPHLFAEDGSNMYHPVIEAVILALHPDVSTATPSFGGNLTHALRAVLSAWDGFMDAENELGIRPGRVGITALFASAADAGGPVHALPDCYRLRAPAGGCAGTHVMRGLWLGANGMHEDGEYRRSVGSHKPHNDLATAMHERWWNTFDADSPMDDVVRTLREYYDFMTPVPARETVAALLEFSPQAP